MQPTGEEPDLELQAEATTRHSTRRLIVALTIYAALGVAAGFRLDGRPRLVVWLFLGLFVVKTLLLVPRQKTD